MSEKERVNHPDHYQSKAGIEVIDVMEAFTDDLKGAEAVNTSQIIKYILRWKHKDNPLEDLKKCKWYLERLINHVENGSKNNNRNPYSGDFELLFDSRAEAEELVEHLNDMIAEYGFATVADMYEYLGLSDTFIDSKYGWVSLISVDIYRVMQGIRVDMPEALPISELLNNK